MALKDLLNRDLKELVPKKWGRKPVAVRRDERDPFEVLQREMNRVFEEFSRGFFDWSPLSTDSLARETWGNFSPRLDVRESAREFEVAAELPGMDEGDIDASIAGGELVIRGEKRTGKEEAGKTFHRMERSYGSFTRSIPLPDNASADGVEAAFRNGVLKIKIPKMREASSGRRIKIETE